MTSISMPSSSAPGLQTTTSTAAPQGNDTSSQIARITQQIVKLTQQLKSIADGGGDADEKQKQADLIQEQITMLEAQLAQLQRQQAEKEQDEQSTSAPVTGVNNPSDNHQIDIYV
jgi:C4-dicarboxylate-specific signal transduction histidine kinase